MDEQNLTFLMSASVIFFTILLSNAIKPLSLISSNGLILVGVVFGLFAVLLLKANWKTSAILWGEGGVTFISVGIGEMISPGLAVPLTIISLLLLIGILIVHMWKTND